MAVPGLEAALDAAGLSGHAAGAGEWCQSMGARDLEEISEEEVFDMLAKALDLKPLERRRLWKAILVGAASGDGGAAAQGVDPAPPAPAAPALPVVDSLSGRSMAPDGPLSHAVFVKNTF